MLNLVVPAKKFHSVWVDQLGTCKIPSKVGRLLHNGTFGPANLPFVAKDFYNASRPSNTWYLQCQVEQTKHCLSGMNLQVGCTWCWAGQGAMVLLVSTDAKNKYNYGTIGSFLGERSCSVACHELMQQILLCDHA